MLIALSAGQKAGIAVVAGVFVAFALASAMLIPRLRPSYPGTGVRAFVLVAILLTAAMLAAVIVLASEGEEEGAAAETGATTQPVTTQPVTTQPVETQPAETTAGAAAAGKAVFAKGGCAACHTLKAAGATGTVGPSLDERKPAAELVVDRVTNGKGTMPPFKGTLSEQEIRDVAAFVAASTQG